jgi:hypothetical protein
MEMAVSTEPSAPISFGHDLAPNTAGLDQAGLQAVDLPPESNAHCMA